MWVAGLFLRVQYSLFSGNLKDILHVGGPLKKKHLYDEVLFRMDHMVHGLSFLIGLFGTREGALFCISPGLC